MNTVGCIKAKMGSTDYFIAKMKAGQLIDSVGFAMEMTEWDKLSVDEKMQRTLDVNRVVTDIVPYIINDPDRFFGAIIVDIYSGFDALVFESVAQVLKDLPAAYRTALGDVGFLTFPGNERLIALDGQHRLLSLKIAIRGFMGLPANTKIPESWRRLEPHPELANEEITVIFVEHRDNQKIRKIFNKVNKYAKQTSRSDNIITSDDDIYAVISRKLIKEGGPLAPVPVAGSFLPDFAIDIVNTKNNTLSLRSKNLTTLSALYTITETLLKDEDYSTKVLPSEEKLEAAYQTVAEFWNILLTKVNAFKEYMDLTKEDLPVSTLRETNLLMKPVTQMALAHAARYAASKGVSWTVMAERLNKVNWSFDNEFWFNILVIPTANRKMITGKESIRGAGLAITYLIMGSSMTSSEKQEVLLFIRKVHNNDNEELPPTYDKEEC